MEDLRPEWKCLNCGHIWKRRTVPDRCPKCGSKRITPWPVWRVKSHERK